MKYILISIVAVVFMSGCSKKEFKDNFHNVKDGTKKEWHKAKDAVSESTKEFAEGK